MNPEQRIELLEQSNDLLLSRVRELQTAVATLVKRLGMEQDVEKVERAKLDQIRLTGEADAPTDRLLLLYSQSIESAEHQ